MQQLNNSTQSFGESTCNMCQYAPSYPPLLSVSERSPNSFLEWSRECTKSLRHFSWCWRDLPTPSQSVHAYRLASPSLLSMSEISPHYFSEWSGKCSGLSTSSQRVREISPLLRVSGRMQENQPPLLARETIMGPISPLLLRVSESKISLSS